MLTFLIVLVVLVVLAVLLARTVHVVPAGRVGVVFRDGTYVRMVTPGLLWLPPTERVRLVATLEQQVRVEGAVLQTEDGGQARADLRVGYRVDDPVRSLTAVDDAAYAVERDALRSLRELAGSTSAVDLLASSVRAADHVRGELGPRLHGWGLEVLRVEVVVHPTDPDAPA